MRVCEKDELCDMALEWGPWRERGQTGVSFWLEREPGGVVEGGGHTDVREEWDAWL